MKSIVSKLLFLSIILSLVSLGFSFVIPISGSGATLPLLKSDEKLPAFTEFIASVTSNDPQIVTGIYVDKNFAFPIIQQPTNNPGFISEKDNTVTQFSLAKNYETIGLLAHNYLGGKHFSELQIGESIAVIYGDGNFRTYQVTNVFRFQALEPSNPYSQFRNISNQSENLSSTELFLKIYGQKGNLVLQTCIQNGKEMSWGRLFIVAAPVEKTAAISPSGSNN